MSRPCHGLCKRYEVKNHLQVYYPGLKRCSICAAFFKTEKWFCMCCGTAMRAKARVPRKKIEHIRI